MLHLLLDSAVYYFFSEEKRFLYSAGAESHRLSVYLHNISHAKD